MSLIVHRGLKPRPTLCLIGCTIAVVTWYASGWTQTIGDEAELERLRVKAEEAIASDDPEGAAMAMGRAAMMAKRLSVLHNPCFAHKSTAIVPWPYSGEPAGNSPPPPESAAV